LRVESEKWNRMAGMIGAILEMKAGEV
jgi:hypothetical protein